MSIINEITENLQKGKAKLVKELAQNAIDSGVESKEILAALLDGMSVIGEKFKNGEVYVSSSKLTYTDFSSVGIGDPISSVLAIDPTLKIDDAFLESASQVALASETSSRLLADGILFITFQVPSAATPSLSEARITEMTFYPYTSEVTPGGGSLSLAQLSLLVASES